MIDLRMTGLVCGPALLIGGLYELTMRDSHPANGQPAAAVASLETKDPSAAATSGEAGTGERPAGLISLRDGVYFDSQSAAPLDDPATLLCLRAATELKAQLDAGSQVLVHPPFVLGGDLTLSRLTSACRDVVLAVQKSLSTTYFDTPPTTPVTIVLLRDDASFQQHALRLDRARRTQDYGYYHRDHRRIVVNLSSGEGTLAHELTHALGHADFPEMPAWLDEGLATLHEECELSEDGLQLIGLLNWRQRQALAAHRQHELSSLRSLILEPRDETADRLTTHAHLRSLCLYLQQRNLLDSVYRKARTTWKSDPTGWNSLCIVLHDPGLRQTEQDFLRWLSSAVETADAGLDDTPASRMTSPSAGGLRQTLEDAAATVRESAGSVGTAASAAGFHGTTDQLEAGRAAVHGAAASAAAAASSAASMFTQGEVTEQLLDQAEGVRFDSARPFTREPESPSATRPGSGAVGQQPPAGRVSPVAPPVGAGNASPKAPPWQPGTRPATPPVRSPVRSSVRSAGAPTQNRARGGAAAVDFIELE